MYRLFLMSLLHMNVLNDVTAALFFGVFFSAASCKKTTKNGAAVTLLRTFVHSNDFSIQEEVVKIWIFSAACHLRRMGGKVWNLPGSPKYSIHVSNSDTPLFDILLISMSKSGMIFFIYLYRCFTFAVYLFIF